MSPAIPAEIPAAFHVPAGYRVGPGRPGARTGDAVRISHPLRQPQPSPSRDSAMSALTLGLPGLTYPDLFTHDGLARLDGEYLKRLQARDPARHDQLLALRKGQTPGAVELSELLLACAPLLDELVGELFGIGKEIDASRAATRSHDPVLAFKKLFVARRAAGGWPRRRTSSRSPSSMAGSPARSRPPASMPPTANWRLRNTANSC
ncbi:MAG: hypothetical protein MZU91_08495 [Desulfosudis oleivorans]|nr:hypothetical protein [Desulfosudis oleivorans]